MLLLYSRSQSVERPNTLCQLDLGECVCRRVFGLNKFLIICNMMNGHANQQLGQRDKIKKKYEVSLVS